MRPVTIGLAALVAGYALSQFYRAFLAVLAPTLEAELGATPGDLAVSSGLWFITFSLMQLPIGWALDAVGPRRTAATLLGLGAGGGAAVFALATQPWHLHVALALIGIGCAPVLMASLFLLARFWPAERFGALSGVAVGAGSLGNILGASPLVAAIDAFGWRPTLWGLCAVTLLVAATIWALVRDPERPAGGGPRGSIREILGLGALWLILPLMFVNYTAPAAIRGVWAGPFLETVYRADDRLIGWGTLAMAVAMAVGNFLIGPLIRVAGGPRTAAIWVSAATIAALAALWLWPGLGLAASIALLAVLGFAGMNYALVMAHGRSFMPPHLVGRGITFLNMVSISGVGILQFASRPVYGAGLAEAGPVTAISRVFLLFLVPMAVGLGIYLMSRGAPDARG